MVDLTAEAAAFSMATGLYGRRASSFGSKMAESKGGYTLAKLL